jgi:cytochrome P450
MFDPSLRANPYPAFRAIRESGPIHWLLQGPPSIGVVSRHADCAQVLQNPALGHVEVSVFHPDTVEAGLRSMLRANPPTHTRLRRLVSKGFTPGRIARFGPQAQALADELLDAAVAKGDVDLVGAFAQPLPLRIMCSLLGVPAHEETVFGSWASIHARGLDPDRALSPDERSFLLEAGRAFNDYFTDLIAKRRAEPAGDLLSDLVGMHDQGDRLSVDELLELCVLLLVAGYETTVNLVSGAVLALARDPEQFDLLRAHRDLVPSAIEETLRYDPPVQAVSRTALAETEVAGQPYRVGDGVVVLLAAANRDPDVFPDPDRFDVTRYAGSAARHFGFGLGVHYCLGAPMARLESEIMLNALLDRVSAVELAADPPPYRPHFTLRGIAELPVHLTPA